MAAAPNPEKELQRLAGVLRGGLPPVVTLLGASRHFREEAFEQVLAAIPADADLRKVDGEQDSDGREVDDLRGGALFGRGCWVAVRRGDGWLKKHGERLLAAIPRIASGCGLLLDCAKLDRRTKLGKELGAHAFQFRDLYTEPYDRNRSPLDAEVIGWIVDRARRAGVKLSREAALLILTTVGSDPGEVLAELRQLREQIDDPRREIGPDELRGTLAAGFESTPFELAEALLAGDRRGAFRSLDAMFRRGVRDRDGKRMDAGGVFPFAASWLYTSLANVHEGRWHLDRGTRLPDVARKVGVRTFQDRFEAQVAANPERRLRRGIELLVAAQRELRETGEEPEWLLHRFLTRWFALPGEAS